MVGCQSLGMVILLVRIPGNQKSQFTRPSCMLRELEGQFTRSSCVFGELKGQLTRSNYVLGESNLVLVQNPPRCMAFHKIFYSCFNICILMPIIYLVHVINYFDAGLCCLHRIYEIYFCFTFYIQFISKFSCSYFIKGKMSALTCTIFHGAHGFLTH